MKTVTVKQCRELGVEFVRGDICACPFEGEYTNMWFKYGNNQDPDFNRDTLKSFAWRTDLPECDQWSGFDFPIEWVGFHGETHVTHNGLFFSANVAKWRPHLESIAIVVHGKGTAPKAPSIINRPLDYLAQREKNGRDLYETYLSKVVDMPLEGSWLVLTDDVRKAWIETAKEMGCSK